MAPVTVIGEQRRRKFASRSGRGAVEPSLNMKATAFWGDRQ